VDKEPAQNQVAAIRDMDLTSARAVATLRSLAAQSWDENRGQSAFRSFFQD
jgi:hypothetical protein